VFHNVAKTYTTQLGVGDAYPALDDVIGVTICDFGASKVAQRGASKGSPRAFSLCFARAQSKSRQPIAKGFRRLGESANSRDGSSARRRCALSKICSSTEVRRTRSRSYLAW
jgi:hypothetical protein